MTITRPRRRITLQFSHIFLTLGRTFTCFSVSWVPLVGGHRGLRDGSDRRERSINTQLQTAGLAIAGIDRWRMDNGSKPAEPSTCSGK